MEKQPVPEESINHTPPIAREEPHEFNEHGGSRIDPYFWLKNKEDQEVLDYLNAENQYTDKLMAETEEFQEELYKEIVARIKQTDMSVPYKLDNYYYYHRYEEGKEYPFYCRKPENLDADEEIMLDVNELAVGHEYYAIRSRTISSNEQMIAYAVDTAGNHLYTIRFKDLETGELLKDEIFNTGGNIAWASDNQTLFYNMKDETKREFKIFRHILGTDPSEDVEIYHETDETFTVHVSRTKSKKFLVIGSYSTVSSEMQIMSTDDPMGEFKVFEPRERDHEYYIDHFGGKDHCTSGWSG